MKPKESGRRRRTGDEREKQPRVGRKSVILPVLFFRRVSGECRRRDPIPRWLACPIQAAGFRKEKRRDENGGKRVNVCGAKLEGAFRRCLPVPPITC